ncbi:MAG: XisI protein [Chloroflexus sp.]|nr:XisI protein [Chloroflexus sp.]
MIAARAGRSMVGDANGCRNGKIWGEADNTDQEIVRQLLDAGIPRESIVLAFYSPQKRAYNEFAVA